MNIHKAAAIATIAIMIRTTERVLIAGFFPPSPEHEQVAYQKGKAKNESVARAHYKRC
jgi:hypothetical protein